MPSSALSKYQGAFLVLALATCSLASFANNAADDAEMELLFSLSLEELMTIQVSSTSYFDETLWNSSASVSVINHERWQQTGAQNVSEALAYLPATTVVSAFSGGSDLVIRGYGNRSSVKGLAIRLDDVPMNSYRLSSGAQDIHQYQLGTLSSIELVRGAGSAMHGANAFHGVLSMASKEALPLQHDIGAEMGDDGYHQTHILSGMQLSNNLRSSMALSYSDRPDQHRRYQYTDPTTQINAYGERAAEIESYSAIYKLISDAQSDSSYGVNFYALHHKSNQAPGVGRLLGGISFGFDEDWTDKHQSLQMAKAMYQQQLSNNLELDINSYYFTTQDKFSADARRSPLARKLDEHRNEKHWGASFILKTVEADAKNRLALGYEYQYTTLSKFSENITLNNGDSSTKEGPGVGVEREVNSLIVDGRYQIKADTWQLVYGARLDHYNDVGHHFSPRISLLYSPSKNAMYKIIYGNAFRAPELLAIVGTPPQIQPNPDVKPEVIDSIELSWLYRQRSWHSNLTLFNTQWQEGIENHATDNPDFFSIYENSSRHEAYGVEATVNQHWQKVSLDSSLSYVKSRNLSTNLDYENFPEYIINLALGYTRMAKNLDAFLHQRIQLQSKESTASDVITPNKLPNFYRTDLVLQWHARKNMDVHFNIRNLFDRNNLLAASTPHENGIPDRRFNFSLEVEYRM